MDLSDKPVLRGLMDELWELIRRSTELSQENADLARRLADTPGDGVELKMNVKDLTDGFLRKQIDKLVAAGEEYHNEHEYGSGGKCGCELCVMWREARGW